MVFILRVSLFLLLDNSIFQGSSRFFYALFLPTLTILRRFGERLLYFQFLIIIASIDPVSKLGPVLKLDP
jgi:hypothetical protein